MIIITINRTKELVIYQGREVYAPIGRGIRAMLDIINAV